MIIKEEFFKKNTLDVAKGLLGKVVVRKTNSKLIKGRILETEAYIGTSDKACHARFGKTKRSEVMWKEGGHIYVYLCYGLHHLLNIVTEPEGVPAAVLIRKIEPLSGLDKTLKSYQSGNLTKYLRIDKSFNGKILGKSSDLWIEDDGLEINGIIEKERIGIDYAEESKSLMWRFIAKTK